MITDKQIEEATRNYSNALDKQQILSFAWRDFKAGAHWASNEFLKGLWHDASEKPMAKRHVIALSEKRVFVYDFQFKEDDDNWAGKFQLLHIVRWAYLDDILPKEGGGK